jgi:hypothetical protein
MTRLDQQLRVVFVGETWNGSCARSLHEALRTFPGLVMDHVAIDRFFPKYRSVVMRAASRLSLPFQRAALEREIRRRVEKRRPAVLLAYKGSGMRRHTAR